MSIERLKTMKENFMCAVEGQMYNLTEVNAKELGEVVDMIKDLSEAIYYCEVAKAMEESEEKEKHSKGQNQEMMYYTPIYYNDGGRNMNGRDMPRMYYDGGNSSGGNGSSGNGGSRGNSYYTEKELPHIMDDPKEGKSYRSRRMYMEAKETHTDKTQQMKELEKYAQELTTDIVEMVEDASPEEKQYLSKKITALAAKINQLNTNA